MANDLAELVARLDAVLDEIPEQMPRYIPDGAEKPERGYYTLQQAQQRIRSFRNEIALMAKAEGCDVQPVR